MPTSKQENPVSEKRPGECARLADELGLPPRLRQNALPSTAQYYGFHRVLASRGRMAAAPPSFRAHWQHGWCGAERQQLDPSLVVLENELKQDVTYFVAREDEAAYLKNLGYRARAVGLPIVYTDDSVNRRPGSLLIMPVHSLEYTEHRWKFQETIDELAAAAASYREVVACIHPACYQHGYWLEELAGHGIPFVIGAEAWDANGLRRVARLFQGFETIVTNGIGSHVAYAMAFGARASIYGPHPEVRKEDVAKTPFNQRNPHLLEPMQKLLGRKAMEDRHPWLYTHPAEALADQEWGRQQIGWENRLNRDEIFSLLHTPPSPPAGKRRKRSSGERAGSGRSGPVHGWAGPPIADSAGLPLRIGLAFHETETIADPGARSIAAGLHRAARKQGGSVESFLTGNRWDHSKNRRNLMRSKQYDLVIAFPPTSATDPIMLIDGEEIGPAPPRLVKHWRDASAASDSGGSAPRAIIPDEEAGLGEDLWEAATNTILESGRGKIESFLSGMS